MGPRIREDNGGGRTVREPALRKRVGLDSSPRLRGGRLCAGIGRGCGEGGG